MQNYIKKDNEKRKNTSRLKKNATIFLLFHENILPLHPHFTKKALHKQTL